MDERREKGFFPEEPKSKEKQHTEPSLEFEAEEEDIFEWLDDFEFEDEATKSELPEVSDFVEYFQNYEPPKAYGPRQGEKIRFPRNTLGRGFAKILEGRERPRSVVDVKASEIKEFRGSRMKRILDKLSKVDEVPEVDELKVSDILSLTPKEVKKARLQESQKDALTDAVISYGYQVMDSPEVKLLAAAYGKKRESQPPLPAKKEGTLEKDLSQIIAGLTPREQKILILRYGLEDFQELTQDKIGEQFQVTKHRIKQIEQKAFRKLRHPSRFQKLESYLTTKDSRAGVTAKSAPLI